MNKKLSTSLQVQKVTFICYFCVSLTLFKKKKNRTSHFAVGEPFSDLCVNVTTIIVKYL